jgi:cell division protein FtsL
MASLASSLPGLQSALPVQRRRRSRNRPVAGRACFPQTYYVKRIDNSRLRREVNLEKRRECYSLLGLSSLAFLFIFLYAWQHFSCVHLGYRIEELKSQRAVLEESNRQLRLKQASLTDPQRIDTLARRRLGLQATSPQQVVLVEPSAPSHQQFANNFSELPSPVRSVLGRGLRQRSQRR